MGRHRLDQPADGRPDSGADDQWATDLAAMASDGPDLSSVRYDGRTSARCQTACQAGTCGHPMTVDGCGGCCGCRGGCAEGYEDQLAEEVPPC